MRHALARAALLVGLALAPAAPAEDEAPLAPEDFAHGRLLVTTGDAPLQTLLVDLQICTMRGKRIGDANETVDDIRRGCWMICKVGVNVIDVQPPHVQGDIDRLREQYQRPQQVIETAKIRTH